MVLVLSIPVVTAPAPTKRIPAPIAPATFNVIDVKGANCNRKARYIAFDGLNFNISKALL